MPERRQRYFLMFSAKVRDGRPKVGFEEDRYNVHALLVCYPEAAGQSCWKQDTGLDGLMQHSNYVPRPLTSSVHAQLSA